tara:strand:- start:10726 stop:11232 length:507 start_codon:yes stop_codon:yes gene_type:complete
MTPSRVVKDRKLLGNFPFISRTFEGRFKDNPYVLDADGNLFIGPADQTSRDEHIAIEVIYHYFLQTGRTLPAARELLRNGAELLDALAIFDSVRWEEADEFSLYLFCTYDGETLASIVDDELPAGPCGRSVNEVKRRFYGICERADDKFVQRRLTDMQKETEARFLEP